MPSGARVKSKKEFFSRLGSFIDITKFELGRIYRVEILKIHPTVSEIVFFFLKTFVKKTEKWVNKLFFCQILACNSNHIGDGHLHARISKTNKN